MKGSELLRKIKKLGSKKGVHVEVNYMTGFNFTYPVTLEKQKEGGYLVRFPDFPEAITQGDDEEQALEAAADCLEEAIANRIVMSLDIPLSTSFTRHSVLIPLHITLAAKCALYLAMRKGNHKNVTLAKALNCDEKTIRRLLDPRYKSKISKIEEALRFLGEKLTVTVSNNYRPDNFPSHKSHHYHQSATR